MWVRALDYRFVKMQWFLSIQEQWIYIHATLNRICFRSLNQESGLLMWCVCQVQSGGRTHLKCVNRTNGRQCKDFIPRQKMVNVRVRVDFLCQLTKCPDN